jgi:basic membrane lipoprotein Med (substrate-binding protein (PBP1-ABC) superfamily)/predicted Zn-dependent protease
MSMDKRYQQALEPGGGAMVGELVNPYIAGAPVTEARMFFGREDVFDWIQNSLVGKYADHILVIHGQRRVGKTSVLKQLGNRLPQRYIPVFFDLQGRTHTTLDRFLWWLAREIVRVLKQERGIEISVPDKDAFSADLEYFEGHFLANLLPVLDGKSLLLTFDEFDNLEESEIKETLARPLVDYLRRLMGRQALNFIFSIGSSGRKLENMQADYTEFFKAALYKKISFLNEEQTHDLIIHPVEGILEYDKPAVNRIYKIAGGHPYFTQLTCHELFAGCQRTGETHIREKDVESVLDDVVERGTVNLKFVWDEASDIEKWALASLAHSEKSDTRALTDALRKQRVRFSESELTSSLLHLREKDILTSENRFVIHLLRLWLQKNRPIEQVREELTEVNPIANRYIEIGLEFKDSWQYEKAIKSFQDALAVSAGNIQAQTSIALVYMDQKDYDKAVGEFEKALAIDDEDVIARAGLCEAHLALGDAATRKGRWKEAAQSYQRVLAINTEHTEARQRMAEISRQRAEKALNDGRDEEALSAFADAMKYAPEDEVLARRVEAVTAEKKAKVIAAQIARSEKDANAKNWEAAVHTLEEAKSLAPDDPDIQKRLAEAREKLREVKLASLRTKAQTAIKVEKFSESLEAWQEYASLEPNDRGKAEEEIARLKKLVELEEVYNKAQQAITDKKYDNAISLLKEVILQDENFKDTSRLLVQAIELRRSSRPGRFTFPVAKILRGLFLAIGIAGFGIGVYFTWTQWGYRLTNLFTAGQKIEKACFIMTADDTYSFRNNIIWHGILNTAESVGIQKQSYLTGISQEEVQGTLEKMYDEDCDLIVGNGGWLKEQFLVSAGKKPDIYFLPVDVNYEGTLDPLPGNLIEQTYKVHDGAYLAGYLAAGTTKTGKVGMFGSDQIVDYREYMEGFVDGVARYNREQSTQIPVIVWDANSRSVIGWPGDWTGWSVENNENQAPYESMANELIRGGADIILIVGVPNASTDVLALSGSKQVSFIGVDVDWKSQPVGLKDAILASIAKNYDLMILKTIKQIVSDTYAGETITGTLENYGVQLAHDYSVYDQFSIELYRIRDELVGIPTPPLPTATAFDPIQTNTLLWEGSPHANREAEAFIHWNQESPPEVNIACVKCHTQTGFLDYIGADGSSIEIVDATVPVGEVLECPTCHPNTTGYELHGIEKVLFLNDARLSFGPDDSNNTCIVCHQGRGSKKLLDEHIGNLTPDNRDNALSFMNNHHGMAGATLFGTEAQGAYEYDGQLYLGRYEHADSFKVCTDCHDPHSTQLNLAACATCHEGPFDSPEDLHQVRYVTDQMVDYDGDGDTQEGIYSEINTLSQLLLDAIQSYSQQQISKSIGYRGDVYPYFFLDTNNNGIIQDEEAVSENRLAPWTPRLLRAVYNYLWSVNDSGAYTHNPRYMIQILYDALKDLGANVSAMSRP